MRTWVVVVLVVSGCATTTPAQSRRAKPPAVMKVEPQIVPVQMPRDKAVSVLSQGALAMGLQPVDIRAADGVVTLAFERSDDYTTASAEDQRLQLVERHRRDKRPTPGSDWIYFPARYTLRLEVTAIIGAGTGTISPISFRCLTRRAEKTCSPGARFLEEKEQRIVEALVKFIETKNEEAAAQPRTDI